MADLLRLFKAHFDKLDGLRCLLFSLLTAICLFQLKQSLTEISQAPTVSVVVLDDLRNIRFPTLTFCHRTPFTQLDYRRLKKAYNMSEELVDALSAGSGMLPLAGYCNFNYVADAFNNSLFSWTALSTEYERLKVTAGLDDFQFMRNVLLNFSYSCDQNFDNTNYDSELFGAGAQNFSKILRCKDGLVSRTWSIERGLCWTVNATSVPATDELSVFPTVPPFGRHSDSFIDQYYLYCLDGFVDVFVSDGIEAKSRNSFVGDLYVEEMFLVEVCSIQAPTECDEWKPKYLPDVFEAFHYSLQNCEADLTVYEYFAKGLGCLPAIYQNPDNLRVCSPLDLARRHFDVAVSRLPYPSSPSLETIPANCPKPCGKRRSYSYILRSGNDNGDRRYTFSMAFSSFDSWLSVQKKQNTAESYFGQIGGLLGLWIGFSVFSIYDYISAVYRLFVKLRDKKITLDQAATTATRAEFAAATMLCSSLGLQLRKSSQVFCLPRRDVFMLKATCEQDIRGSATHRRSSV